MRNELMTDIQIMEERLMKLDKDVREVKQSCLTGLTTEELQGIHGLILGQIKLIAELQEGITDRDGVREICIPVETLRTLVSLVSKPTD